MAVNSETDADLVLATRNGDKQAFGRLVERYLPMARRFALRLLNNQEIVQDLAQEAMLQAYLSLDNLREADKFQRWLYGIVRNVCHNYLRSQKADFFSWEVIGDGNSTPSADGDPQDLIERHELSRLVQKAVRTLSTKNQIALWLFYDEQLSVTEIALRLNISVAAVKDRLYQSRKKLREQLEPIYTPTSIAHRLWVANNTVKSEVAQNERRSGMVKISVVHSFAVEETDHYIVYLTDIEGQRILPIWIGLFEGNQIAQSLQEGETGRPMTYHLMANLLNGLGAKLQEVRIEELKDNTFYAVIKAQNGNIVQELDARPSDAIALALHMQAPVFVSADLMAKVGQPLPEPWDEKKGPEELHRSLQRRSSKEWQRKIEESTDFTARGQQVWAQMEAEALRLHHNYIGTEHLLLALVQDQESTSAQVLRDLKVDPKQINEAVVRLVGQEAQSPPSQPIIVPRMVKVVEYSLEAKNQLGHPALGTGHFLLGLVREGHGMAITILRNFNVDPEQLRIKTIEALSTP